jgi:hypothetical protein
LPYFGNDYYFISIAKNYLTAVKAEQRGGFERKILLVGVED